MNSVLVHDMKNMALRLNLLLSNVEAHYGDPSFKRSVVDGLSSTLEKLDTIAGRYTVPDRDTLHAVSIDVNALLREVTSSARGRSGSASRIVTELGEVSAVEGDRDYLREALTNLVQNALEAAGARGTVRVTTSIAAKSRKPTVLVEVSDNGPGMDAAFLREKLFRPYQTTKPGGVGLGLYSARQLVRLHGGDIDVESRPGAGTCVRVRLPGTKA